MIRVVNIKGYKPTSNEVLVKVDRSNKILGNMFVMKEESERDSVCDKYDNWFNTQVKNKNEIVLKELRKIYRIALKSDVALGCWCFPKRCHAYTIKKFLDQYLPKPQVANPDDSLMIVNGNILKVKEGMIVHQLNNCGKMHLGLANDIRKLYPTHYTDYISKYRLALKKSESDNVNVVSLLGQHVDTKVGSLTIRGIFAQDGYGTDRQYTSYRHLQTCFNDIARAKIDTVYIPYGLGCGLAGGDWNIVSKMILETLPNAIIVKYDK